MTLPAAWPPAHLLASSFQTREQLQADLLRCQAKIEDLEKLLAERGQVSSGCVMSLGPEGDIKGGKHQRKPGKNTPALRAGLRAGL